MSARVHSQSGRWARESGAVEYRVIYLLAFPVFLLSTVGARLLRRSGRAAHAEQGKSIFAQAKGSTQAFVPFAFMG